MVNKFYKVRSSTNILANQWLGDIKSLEKFLLKNNISCKKLQFNEDNSLFLHLAIGEYSNLLELGIKLFINDYLVVLDNNNNNISVMSEESFELLFIEITTSVSKRKKKNNIVFVNFK